MVAGKHVKQLSLDITRAQIKEMEKESLAVVHTNLPENLTPASANRRPKENEEQLTSPAQHGRHAVAHGSFNQSDNTQVTNVGDFTPKILNENTRKMNQAMTFGEQDVTPKSTKTEDHKFERIKTINEIIGKLDQETFKIEKKYIKE